MPGCAAIGCNNRSEKGYSMKCFPRDPLLRQLWKERVGRANWEPSKNSFLCHDHFEPSQWVETENGKVKLKRDAVPSIFTETSTRKSHKKKRLENSNTMNLTVINLPVGESEDDNNYTLEYLDDCKYMEDFNTLGSTKKDIASNADTNSIQKLRKNYGLAYRIVSEKDVRGLENENIIIVSDENDKEIGKLIHNSENIIIVADENNKEIGQIVVEDNLGILGQRNLGTDLKMQDDKYDEIERQLRQICNGEDVADALTDRKDFSSPTVETRSNTDGGTESLTQKHGDNGSVTWTEDSKVDTEIPETKKPMFSTGGSEKMNKSNADSPQMRKLAADINKAGGRLDNESRDMQKTRSPLKRQRRSEEDVMRSIERAISELSERTIRSVQNDQLVRSIQRISRARRKRDKKEQESGRRASSEMINHNFEFNESDSASKRSKFTIKVTGVADDVSKIMEGLDPSSRRIKYENNAGGNQTLNYIVPEMINEENLIRLDSRFIEEQVQRHLKSDGEFSSEFDSVDFPERCTVEGEVSGEHRARNRSNQILSVRRTGRSAIEKLFQRNNDSIHTEESDTKNERKKLLAEENERIRIENRSSEGENNRSMLLKYFNKSQDPTRKLRQKINAQQEVIRKLTNQLIIYKGLEAKLASLNSELEMKKNEIELVRKKLEEKSQEPPPEQDESECKNVGDNKEKTISDLSNKVNRLKEANKKLTQQITAESQTKKLALSLKQRDERIKELNWKLEKASKFLDRAEKNANTYKRKMVSMQTAIRRQKALDERRNHFQKLLIDNAKHEFSESALLTAMDIKNTCGIKCYQKLLSYNFPLPSLRTLRRRFQKENHTELDWEDQDQDQDKDKDRDPDRDQDQKAVSSSENQEDKTSIETLQSNEFCDTEVTGTVQDIFEENNDTEELNSSEFGEQIFMQLNNDVIFANT